MSASEYTLTKAASAIDPRVGELAAEAARLRRMHVDDYIQVLIDADIRGVKPRWHKGLAPPQPSPMKEKWVGDHGRRWSR